MSNLKNKRKILLGLTTTPKSDWYSKIKEIDKYKINEIALFPTFLATKERRELYRLLSLTNIKNIPIVHLRGQDMENWELELLLNKYKTQKFNIHYPEAKFAKDHPEIKDKIYLENNDVFDQTFTDTLNLCQGICLDLAHYEDLKHYHSYPGIEIFDKLLQKSEIGFCHIGAISPKKGPDGLHERHFMNRLSELNYVQKYIKLLPKFLAIELENSFADQLEAKKYLEKIIAGNSKPN